MQRFTVLLENLKIEEDGANPKVEQDVISRYV
jgi:hypothetical protein